MQCLASWNWKGQDGENFGADALRVRQIPRGGNVLSGGRSIVGIDCIDQIIFVTGFVLHEQNVFAVAAPEVSRNWSRRIGRNRFGGIKRRFSALDPDVARPFERLDEVDEFASGEIFAPDISASPTHNSP